MIYAGVEDFICNWVGNQRWVDTLPWYGKGQWAAAQDQDWAVDGKAAGTAKAVGPLTFVKVDAAGHMVSDLLTCGCCPLLRTVSGFALALLRRGPDLILCCGGCQHLHDSDVGSCKRCPIMGVLAQRLRAYRLA